MAPASGARQAAPSAGPSGLPQGVTREQMWYAPTAEDWKKPCLIQWQRSFEDALEVSKETGKPVLVCVNMDGEIASEHYAGVRYRQPEIAALYEPYVCVIASVYRHNPRDYDEQGNRIVCPRFGTVTCGEHIAIEPGLFEKFMDGRRIAPRHIGVETHGVKDGTQEMYDVFYAWDTDTIFNSLKKGIAGRKIETRPLRGDRTLFERVESADSHDKDSVELAYRKGDRALRRGLLQAAVAAGDKASPDLLRLALYDLDEELSRLSRQALAKSNSESAVELINDALRLSVGREERDALLAALVRIGEKSPRARTLAVVHQGLATKSDVIDVDGWTKALEQAGRGPADVDAAALDARVEYQVKAARANRESADAQLALAEAALDQVRTLRASRKNVQLAIEDARLAALEAERLGAKGARVNTVLSLTAYYLGDLEEARRRAERAVEGFQGAPDGANAVEVLALFADARQKQIMDAQREKKPWPPKWLTDVHSAQSVLARHPLGTDYQVASYYDFLCRLGAVAQASKVLDAGLERFPDSWVLHDRLRGRILFEKGAAGLEPHYETWLADKGESASLEWYAGYASLVAAEFHRRAGDSGKATEAYGRALAHYAKVSYANPAIRDNAEHYAAIALGGLAKIAYERGDYATAVERLLEAFERKPESSASLDGLNVSAVDTAKLVRVRLRELKEEALLAKLQAGLDALDPIYLQLPAYEFEGPPEEAPASGPASRPGGRRARR